MKKILCSGGYRSSVLSRAIAAIIGGYSLVSLFNIFAPLVLSTKEQDQGNALLWMTIASFPLYAVVIMGAFYARSAIRAWLWIVSLNLLITAGIYPLWPEIYAR